MNTREMIFRYGSPSERPLYWVYNFESALRVILIDEGTGSLHYRKENQSWQRKKLS